MTSHSTHNFLDGIQVRVTEKYKPPRRVILPPEYTDRLQQDIEAILDLDYDFKLEENVLASYPPPSVPARESLKRQAENYPSIATGVMNEGSRDSSRSPDMKVKPARPPPPVPTGSNVTMNPLLASVSYRPLEPQKATQRPASASPNALSKPQIDEFEPTAANPFDNMELKSLNDMEELTRVLANASPSTTVRTSGS